MLTRGGKRGLPPFQAAKMLARSKLAAEVRLSSEGRPVAAGVDARTGAGGGGIAPAPGRCGGRIGSNPADPSPADPAGASPAAAAPPASGAGAQRGGPLAVGSLGLTCASAPAAAGTDAAPPLAFWNASSWARSCISSCTPPQRCCLSNVLPRLMPTPLSLPYISRHEGTL